MTAERIDVLAVLDHCAPRAATREQRQQLTEARAAVAELIEATRKIAGSSPSEDGCFYTNRSNISIARAALARIGGAA